jgi:alanyl-tRNA synthetase
MEPSVLQLNSDQIRRAFLEYFVARGHLELPGLPLVPNDSSITTLFTIAGMQQMIPYFLGREKPPAANMVTVQRTIRTNDILEVGDTTHCTFFEMLGNFSVGSEGGYFKREAIAYTWDFLVSVLGIPADRWWAVTYPGDEEARNAWIEAGIPLERIGETPDNWWGPPGEYGPCGPNSEIHYDRGVEYGCGREDCSPVNECCDRFVEVWNDVFMSYYQDEEGTRTELSSKNVDTGMGFERLVMVLQSKDAIYDTDLYQPVIASVSGDVAYGQDQRRDRSLRIVADHSRAVTFIAAGGVMPSSEGRGYVLRRLIRRAALHGRLLGIEQPFLSRPISQVIDILGGFYADVAERRDHVISVVRREEERFLQTLSRGLTLFEVIAERAASGNRVISGEDAFALYDTHGFPLEMTVELAEERDLQVDQQGFEGALREQQERARNQAFRGTIGASPETYIELAKTESPTVFTGYDELRSTAEVLAILAEGRPVRRSQEGDEVEVILDITPFYSEAGGQVGDSGVLRGDSTLVRVEDTQRPYASFIVHKARVVEGTLSVGDEVCAEVDEERRLHILPHHSATHLLHKALQEVLGSDARQAGSLVAPDHLRFDFTWPRALTLEEIRDVQDRVNAAIWANLPVRREVLPYDEAIREGAMALFGEKYGDRVRVVSMGDWSKELCGGTHVGATGDIGLVVIISESGIGSGVRRIEALAGAAAYAYVNDQREQLREVAASLDARPDTVVARAQQVVAQARDRERRIETLTRQLAEREADALVARLQENGAVDVVSARISASDFEYVRAVSDAVKSRLDAGAVVLGAIIDEGPKFTLALTRKLKDRGYNATAILRQAAKQVGIGGAGGTEDFAQGGGSDAAKLDAVLQATVDLIRRRAEG